MRAGAGTPKQYRTLAGLPVLRRSVSAFATHDAIGQIVVVIHPDDRGLLADALGSLADRVTIVTGGATRAESVRAGLAAVTDTDAVLIHDAARPLVRATLITRVVAALDDSPGAAPAVPVSDALWRGSNGKVSGALPRAGLFRAQTPQGFHLGAIRFAHAGAPEDAADDVEVALAAGLDVAIVEGDEDNMKITGPGDFTRAARLLKDSDMDIRTGNGFDVHRFGPGASVTLCGVTIPHEAGLVGHSDADVGIHALCDAIYGALAMGDIGRHFPPGDPQWKDAASHVFLAHAAGLARASGFNLTHMDVTLICEAPKIGPHAAAMSAELARIAGLSVERVSVKATTSERLGFTGRGEGIAAMATATLVKT